MMHVNRRGPRRLSRLPFSMLAALLLFPGLSASQPISAPSPTAQAYAAFQRAMDSGDMPAALRHASEAAQLARAEFGREHVNTATLLGNYAAVLIRGGDRAQARTVLEEVDSILIATAGEDAIERVEPQLVLAGLYNAGTQPRLAHAWEALRIQQAAAPEDRIAHARLATRVGALLAEIAGGDREAVRLLTEALGTLEAEYGASSPELVDTLSALADAEARFGDPSRQMARYERALRILRSDPQAQADLYLRAGRQIMLLSASDGGRGFLRRAQGQYRDLHGPGHPGAGYAALSLGELEIARGRERAAEPHLLEAIGVLAGHPEERSGHLRALSLLVGAYERQRRGDRATPYVMQIAQLAPWQPDQAPSPLVRFAPVYPQSAAYSGLEGWVIVEFTIDAGGRVVDPVVVESAGPDVFHRPALEVIQRFRYAPRFENGVAVETTGVKNRFTFEIGDD